MGSIEQWVKEFVSGEETHLMASFDPRVLSKRIPRPSGSDSILHRLVAEIFLGKLLGPDQQLECDKHLDFVDP